MRQLAAYAAAITGAFSAAVVAGAGITVWALRRRHTNQERSTR
jgi:low affinity Fe/Cu permease